MKISESWLKEWVDFSWPTEQLATLLTMAGLEVGSISPAAGDFSDVIVAQVKHTKPHPQADRLTVCEVDTGETELLQVVCGASNVRSGLKVALAKIGAKLPADIHIKETKLRGELSQGMLCSASELGLSESSEGIIELADDAPLGTNLRDYLQLHDQILEIELTPNRADCLSVLGVAREISAMMSTPLKPVKSAKILPAHQQEKKVHIQAQKACPRYCGRIIQGINTRALTPVWLSERLRRSGVRAIHPVVDVLNYVMLELGQPMHAFDLQKIDGDLCVRYAQAGESLVLLDGKAVELTTRVLVIADEKKALAMAGVMGGEASAVSDETVDIFLESAYFTAKDLAGVARSYGLTTEASQRFERGIDPTLPGRAIERATELLLSIVGGKAGPVSEWVHQASLPQSVSILFNPERVKQLIGIHLPLVQMKEILESLGLQVVEEKSTWVVSVPPHRVDLNLDVDLVEEIIRVYGYDKILSERMQGAVLPGSINPLELMTAEMTQFFTQRGYHETITYSFVDPKWQELLFPDALMKKLLNPISAELSSMRLSLWPGLLASMMHNRYRQQTSMKLFESGVTFVSTAQGFEERACVAGLIVGELGTMDRLLEKRPFDFYDIKGDLQALFTTLKLPALQYRVLPEQAALHPGKAAELFICSSAKSLHEEPVGFCGVLHPEIAEALDLGDEVILFELALQPFIANQQRRFYQAISKFPLIRRDLALLVDSVTPFADIEAVIKQAAADLDKSNLLKSVEVFDVYVGVGIPDNKKSLAVSLVLQDEHRTLVDSEINEVINAILEKLDKKLAITLRD